MRRAASSVHRPSLPTNALAPFSVRVRAFARSTIGNRSPSASYSRAARPFSLLGSAAIRHLSKALVPVLSLHPIRRYSSQGGDATKLAAAPAQGAAPKGATSGAGTAASASKPQAAAKPPQGEKKQKMGKPTGSAAPAQQSDISRLEIRIGRVTEVQKHTNAENLYLGKIDIGEHTPRSIVAGLVKHVTLEEMKDRFVVVLANLAKRSFVGEPSEGMLLVAQSADKTIVEPLGPPAGVTPGERVTIDGETAEPEKPHVHKKVLERVMPLLKVNADGLATYNGAILKTSKGPVKVKSLKNVQIS